MAHKNEFASSGSSPTPDFLVANHFSIFLLTPLTPVANAWIESNLPEDHLTFAGAVVIEHRYIAEIVRGAIADGFQVKAA